MPAEYTTYSSNPLPLDKRMSSLSLTTKVSPHQEFASVNRYSQKFDPYQDFLYRNNHLTHRRRLSSTGEASGNSSTTGEGSGDSSSTTASGSSYGEREDGSEGRAESEETEERETDRKPLEGQITELELQQVASFFKGLKTEVHVCESLANLYTKSSMDSEWQLKFTGIPVVILDVGEARSRDKRRIQIVLAERGTSFMLWHDTIDNLSSYRVAGKAFHTMCYSADHTIQVGFSFDTAKAAHDMWAHIERLVADPENISLSMPGKKKKKKDKKHSKPVPLPPKSDISQPCCFQHITSIERDDTSRFFSLKEFLPRNYNSRLHNIEDI